MGQVFYPAAVRELSSEVSDASDGIAALVRKQFVRPERSDLAATDALGFRHLLIRDAAYGSIPKATRADLHERFAAWLDGRRGRSGSVTRSSGITWSRRTGIAPSSVRSTTGCGRSPARRRSASPPRDATRSRGGTSRQR